VTKIKNMAKSNILLLISISFFYTTSCNENSPQKASVSLDISLKPDSNILNLVTDVPPLFEDGDVNAIIEIPTGTIDKWELDKTTGKIQWELVDDKPRIIKYLGYPGNYGMIPRTLLSKKNGGDGDPLDILVLGPPVTRGQIIKCKIIGVLYLLDRGEKDDKLIAISNDSPLYRVNSIKELNDDYKGVSEILQLWFENYKGPGKMESKGFGDKNNATNLLEAAIKEYQLNDTKHNTK
jgi:inorganic pyrophosphatase